MITLAGLFVHVANFPKHSEYSDLEPRFGTIPGCGWELQKGPRNIPWVVAEAYEFMNVGLISVFLKRNARLDDVVGETWLGKLLTWWKCLPAGIITVL